MLLLISFDTGETPVSYGAIGFEKFLDHDETTQCYPSAQETGYILALSPGMYFQHLKQHHFQIFDNVWQLNYLDLQCPSPPPPPAKLGVIDIPVVV